METIRLYEQDSHIRRFSAQVLACAPGKHGYDVVLDQSAFYPEGGGQPGDRGVLSGVTVSDTHEVDGRLVHYCGAPLAVGSRVEGEIDWEHRFSLMQLHSGEHILSGLIHAAHSYHNVGFHMGAAMTTIDFSGPLTWDQLREVERKANEAVWQDLPVEISFPDEEARKAIAYRSKKELTGRVRLVTFPGIDTCACCGTHVQHTGEIGLIKIFSCQKFHEGVRLEILCGKPAYDYATTLIDQNRQNSALLSAQPHQTAAATEKLLEKQEQTKFRAGLLERKYAELKAEQHRDEGSLVLFEQDLTADGLRLVASRTAGCCGGFCAVFSGSDDAGYSYVIAQEDGDLRQTTKHMNQALNGRGGGKPGLVQGSVRATQRDIQDYFSEEFGL